LASTTATLQKQLTASLLSMVPGNIPAGSITYDNAYVVSFGPADITSQGSSTASVSISGTLTDVAFRQSDLVALLGAQQIKAFGGLPYDISGLDGLSFSIVNPTTFSPSQKNLLLFHISGSFKLIGSVPVDELKTKFAGKTLAQTKTILEPYAPIIDLEQSQAELTPPWVSNIPTDTSRISIIVKNE